MDDARFERLVAEALDSLPEQILAHLENVDVVVEYLPSAEDLAEVGLEGEPPESLLGLYFGIPLTERDSAYAALPDRIVLYQGSIEAVAEGDPDVVREEVRDTVIHEIAHYYGISDERLEELDWD